MVVSGLRPAEHLPCPDTAMMGNIVTNRFLRSGCFLLASIAFAQSVPRFSVQEITLRTSQPHDRPYAREIVSARISGPGSLQHYADVRIMPTCVGNPACGAVIAAMESA